jgi:hypothetical protein
MKKKVPFYCALVITALTTTSVCTYANDTSFGDDNGTIVFKHQPDISMDKEVLLISPDRIQVDYVFTNNGKTGATIPIAFPMPPMYFGPSDHSEIQDFKLTVNGADIKTSRRLVVLLDGKIDITAKVAALGWSEKDLVELFPVSDIRPKGKKPLPEDWFNGIEPRFTLNEYFTWQQTFPAGQPVLIRHSYTPSVTTGIPRRAGELIAGYAKETCMDDTFKTAIKRRRESTYGLPWTHLSYILLTANNWQGPIKDFTLRIRKREPTDLISMCFDDDLTKVDPSTFEFRRQNYRPNRNLSVLFIGKLEQ